MREFRGQAMANIQKCRSVFAAGAMLFCICCGISAFTGCERKERVLDVQTPEGDVQVDRNVDTGEVEVNVTDED
jgi:hypothetical protein